MKNEKKHRIIPIPILLTLLLCSCNLNDNYFVADNVLTIENPYCGDSLKGSSTSLTFLEPQQMLSFDNILIVLTNQNGHFINIIDCASDSVISSFGEIGHAKNEFIDFPQCMYRKTNPLTEEHLLYIPDNSNQITRVVNIEKSVKEGVCHVDSVIKHDVEIKGESAVYCLNDANKLWYFNVTYEDPRDNIFYPPRLIEKDKVKSYECHPFPRTIFTSSFNIMRVAYESKCSISPDMDNFIIMMRFIDNLFMYNVKTKKTIGITTIDTYDFTFFNKKNDINEIAEQLHIYNVDVSTTNSSVFILKTKSLYSNLISKEEKGVYDFPSYLHVYNWEGLLKYSYQLDVGIISICYNETYGYIYALSAYGHIIKYNLPNQ